MKVDCVICLVDANLDVRESYIDAYVCYKHYCEMADACKERANKVIELEAYIKGLIIKIPKDGN